MKDDRVINGDAALGHAPNVLHPLCPSRQVLGHLTSRWGALILVALAGRTLRFSALRRALGNVSERMLAQTLQGLEADGMVRRVAHDVVPPHVDYSLTEIGEEAAALVTGLAQWVERRMPEIMAKRGAGC
jgi:DNA-binding HxlR family transcriptional regulator